MLTNEEASALAGLECQIDQHRVAVPVGWVDKVIEYEVTPLPLGERFVGGVGLFEGRIVVSLVLEEVRELKTRTTKGVLLNIAESDVAWAIEVGKIAAFVSAHFLPAQQPEVKWPKHVRGALTSTGEAIGFLDVEALLKELSSQ